MNIHDIQKEVIRKFPIGCKFIPVGASSPIKLLEDYNTYKITGNNKSIWAHTGAGDLYKEGKWATLVSLPESKEESIPEYIECTSSKNSERYFIKGNVYKVVKASPISSAELRCNILKDYKEHNILYTRLVDTDGTKLFKPSTKEAYDAQNAPKRLKKEDLVAGEIYIYDDTQISTYPEGPSLGINGKKYIDNPKWAWCLTITHATEEQKALLRGEIEKNTVKSEYTPQVGDYVLMEKAGGWGYHPSNNGCIAIVEKISTREVGVGSDSVRVVSISGQLINAKELNNVRFIDVPIIGHEKQTIVRKAFPHEIPNTTSKSEPSQQVKEWSKGTYAVGLKGNFGLYKGSDNLVTVGSIFTMDVNRGDRTVGVKESQYWIYKENLKWFATYDEAVQFSKRLPQFEASPTAAVSESPLEICKRKYKKGMLVRSAKEYGEYSGEFIIDVDPSEFTNTGSGVDYFASRGWLYINGKFADILEEPKEQGFFQADNEFQKELEKKQVENLVSKPPQQLWLAGPIVEQRINTPSIKKETFIDNVQSVDVVLRTKKKSIKF